LFAPKNVVQQAISLSGVTVSWQLADDQLFEIAVASAGNL
jgi:hypothetical protein